MSESEQQLVGMIADLVAQAIPLSNYQDEPGQRFSGFITIYADAMRLLAGYGVMEIKDNGGRSVYGKFRDKERNS